MRVMQLHIEELMRQTELRERELQRTQAQLKEHAKQRAVQQPQERQHAGPGCHPAAAPAATLKRRPCLTLTLALALALTLALAWSCA